MPRHEIRYKLDDGSRVSITELLRSEDNTWPVSYQCLYQRLLAGERSLKQLFRPPKHRLKAPQASKAERVSPWRLGPAVRTERSLQTHEKLRELHRPEVSLAGARLGALTVLRHGPLMDGLATWTCQCDCGDKVTFRTDALNMVRDCGCGISERREAR